MGISASDTVLSENQTGAKSCLIVAMMAQAVMARVCET